MDTRPAEHLTEDQIRTINSLRSLEEATRSTLRVGLKRGGETSGPPPLVAQVFADVTAFFEKAILATIRHPHH